MPSSLSFYPELVEGKERVGVRLPSVNLSTEKKQQQT